MCGIVGYIGNKDALPILIDGLKRLEYRGYDSAGVAIIGDDLKVVKTQGRISDLENKLKNEELKGSIGLGHTRWATHGVPNDVNAHPHLSESKSIVVIHNGIIENYLELKKMLVKEGRTFRTDTDTEVIAYLIEEFYEGDLLKAVKKTVELLEGSYAIAVMSKNERDRFVAVRKDSPLVAGLGQGENFIASDIPAILPYTKNIIILENGDIIDVRRESINVYDKNLNLITRNIKRIDWRIEDAQKGGFKHFMLKEIFEEPDVIREAMRGRVRDAVVEFPELNISLEYLKSINQVYFVACGTAYHAGVFGKYLTEKYLRIPAQAEVASEFRYRDPVIDEHTLLFVISQSGETTDTLAALRFGKEKGARTIGIANVVGSSVTREVDQVVYIHAGPEIAVASTKAYVAQVEVILLLIVYFAKLLGKLTKEEESNIVNDFQKLEEKARSIVLRSNEIADFVSTTKSIEETFYIGRNLDFALSLEGALKLKEISYVHAEGYPAGELKHGPLALVTPNSLVIAVITYGPLKEKTLSNIKEVKARGGKVLAIAQEGYNTIEEVADRVFYVPKVANDIGPIINVIPLQLIAYYMAEARGLDIDKPRNLAKSVTVE
ncbi:MAG: glutamine--fructose-6-phosphate transaminase (isomerizing) [Caldiserica bacterium CG02_land_8_20_14_3_00_36_38]|nr:glutamine--fructose-6-phosphate transaminase (isomerizing) [Caldisericota bacterium]OIP12488.1 MAG: glutamine--fructose-6-phosphate aminotransferase [Caldisericum sp. CG2_30_36_11]PIP49723.1 MAG: glutamine--fructose-6-phosphate transaminase (isomerizing) [Caldiserica bacterium CG23_combo_of_CG06-09_8_20_14_all_35_60]PIV57009.1 MAG: glutamine--fructose-6-phosphate transaminase (isomerizing) [Caldiserica bacterium CG02_land_8_20_14_3_00_36_38]PIW10815.1 MAG: glutamine--fructose-6-phosphate tra